MGAYALAATAAGVATLALAIPAEGAPVCKNPNAVLAYTSTFGLSLGDQPIAALNVAQSFHTFSTLTSTGVNRGFFTPNLPGAAVAVSSRGLVADLASGARIGPGGQFGKGAMYGLIFTFIPDYGATSRHHLGNLRFGQTNYLGFKFLILGESHYGWVRVESTIKRGTRTPSIQTNIMAYGYESDPNTAIPAGSCTATSGTTIGALALGAPGIPLWRRK
jgi:hypothetical protein